MAACFAVAFVMVGVLGLIHRNMTFAMTFDLRPKTTNAAVTLTGGLEEEWCWWNADKCRSKLWGKMDGAIFDSLQVAKFGRHLFKSLRHQMDQNDTCNSVVTSFLWAVAARQHAGCMPECSIFRCCQVTWHSKYQCCLPNAACHVQHFLKGTMQPLEVVAGVCNGNWRWQLRACGQLPLPLDEACFWDLKKVWLNAAP